MPTKKPLTSLPPHKQVSTIGGVVGREDTGEAAHGEGAVTGATPLSSDTGGKDNISNNPPTETSPIPDGEPTPEEARRELQAILGQLHGLISRAMERPSDWCPSELIPSLEIACLDLGKAFGQVQAELNSGKYDSKLVDVGLAGKQMEPKKKGFWQSLKQFFNPSKEGEPFFLGALGFATRWSGIIVGSLSRLIPGAEVIKEGIEVIHAARDQYKDFREAGK